MNHFKDCANVESIKFTYRKLCFKHHPDRPNGSTVMMQDINRQYQLALKSVHGKSSASTDGQEHTYYYHEQTEAKLMSVIDQLLKLHMQDITIGLIGTWLWIYGNSMPYRNQLKQLGCAWSGKRQSWYFHSGPRCKRSSSANLTELADKYGFKSFVHAVPALIH